MVNNIHLVFVLISELCFSEPFHSSHFVMGMIIDNTIALS